MQELTFAFRQLRKHSGFAFTAVAVLAVGIAANVAMFAFADAALIRPLPYLEPSRLVTAFAVRPEDAGASMRGSLSYLDFVEWRARNRVFSAMAAYDVRAGFTLTTDAAPEAVSGLRVTAGFFRTLGVEPVLGREFTRAEEGISAPAAVMLSYRAWQTRFGGRHDVLGRTLILQSPWLSGGEPHVIIGVLPRHFIFPMARDADYWAAIRGAQPCWQARRCRSVETVARLDDGISMPAATANLTLLVQQLRTDYPNDHRYPEVARLSSLREVMLGDVPRLVVMLMSGAGVLLLIAGLNVISLLLARSESRTRETAVRSALGASSARLMRQFATEALVLVAIASGLGLMLSIFGIQFLINLLDAEMLSRMPYLQTADINMRVLAFTAAIALIAAVVFAVAPLARWSGAQALSGLREARGSAGSAWRRIGANLVVGELTLAVILLVSAGLLGKSFYRLLHVNPGFNIQRLALVSVSQASVPASDQSGMLAREVAARVAALPGVEAAAYADLVPLGVGLAPSSTFWVMGRTEHAQLKEDWPVRQISAGYFTALQATLSRGRHFTEEEVASMRPVMIINDTAARRYFPDGDAIGHSVAFGGPTSPAREIVGIVADIKEGPPESPSMPAAYVPFDQTDFTLVVRSSRGGQIPFATLGTVIRAIRPGVLVQEETTMTDRLRRLPSASLTRASAWLVGTFAAIAFLLSVIGLYGVVAYSVGLRSREIGVRVALGAHRGTVYQLVIGEAARLVVVGLTLGISCAMATATLMRGMFFGVEAWDAPTLITVAAVLGMSALLASYVPARRAASVNPIEVLRGE